MRRSRLESLLHDYVAGDLDAQERVSVEQRLEREPETRALLAEVRAAHEALTTLRDRSDPPVGIDDVFPRIQTAIASEKFRGKPQLYLRSEGTRFYRRLALAATLLLAVTAGLFAYNRLGSQTQTPTLIDNPTAEERGLKPYEPLEMVELGGRPEGITGAELVRLLEERKNKPRELRVTPVYNVVPVTRGTAETR